MKRAWNNRREPMLNGSEEASQVATALANLCDAETLRSLLDIKIALDRFGGEAYIGAYREKHNALGEEVGPDEVGSFETIGYVYEYNHVATNTRSATGVTKERDDKFNEERPLPQVVQLPPEEIEWPEDNDEAGVPAPELESAAVDA